MKEKPEAKVIGLDGNIYNVMGIAQRAMKNNNIGREVIDEMIKRVTFSNSYEEALLVIQDYVEFV